MNPSPPWKTLSRSVILDHGRFLVVENHVVALPDGRVIHDWPWVITPDYVNVVAETGSGDFLFFRQTKYAIDGPALAPVGGYLEPHEDPLHAAQRELLEETGHAAAEWVALGTFVVDANRGAGTAHLFLARGARRVADPTADDLEEQRMLTLTRAEMESALRTGEFRCVSWATVVALALQHLGDVSPVQSEETLAYLIQTRRSIRRYRPDPIPRGTIHRLLEAAIWAPSAHNRQPWRFAVIASAAVKQRLALAMGNRLRADRTRDGDAPDAIERDVQRSRERITGAPVVIAVCLSMVDMDRYPDERRASAERTMAVQSVAMAVQNLLLMAHASGLGACWMCAPLFCPDTVREALSLPDDWEAQALITVGRPDGETPPRDRAPVESRTLYID
jgi:F420 biosynthesis protein FbiB-like protein